MANLDRDYYLDEQGLQTLINELETNLVALEYSSSATYAVGDYCVHDNKMYRCTTAISTAENWNSAHWSLVIISDELKSKKSGTVTSVTIKGTSPIVSSSSSAITTSGTRTISHANSGVTAGDYTKVTVNATGHVTNGSNPTTLSGYGITDAKIESGTITLGSDTITPLTSHQTVTDGNPTLDWNTQSTVATIGGTDIHVTMPADPNTDTKVRQTRIATNYDRPLLMSSAQTSSTTTNIDNVVYRNNDIYANPSTGTITATKFVGDISGGTNLSSTQVTGALGYTPYDSANPAGYTDNIGTVTQVKVGTTAYDPSSGVVSLPAYPTVNNATLTIQKNGSTVKTFTANASSNVTANITVPTSASDVGALPDTTKYALSDSVGGDALNAKKVNNLTVETAVPSGAVFTDTTYTGTSPISVNSSTHDISLSTVPIAKGGTNATTKLGATDSLSVLYGLAGGTLLVADQDCDSLTVGATYYSNSSTLSDDLVNPPTTSSGFKIYTLGTYNSSYPMQLAFLPSGGIMTRGKYKDGSNYPWTDWRTLYHTGNLISQPAASGGTTKSLVTTGEKYTWNNKATSTDITNAINNLDVTETTVAASKTISKWSETNGKVSISTQDIAIANTQVSGLGTASVKNVPASGNASSTEVVMGNDSRLNDSRTPTSHSHGNITNAGVLSSDITIANGDQLVVTDKDSSTAYQIARSPIKFDASTTTKALTPKGTWETFLQSHQSVTDNNPTLAWSTKSKVATIGSTDIHVTMPSNPNTDENVLQSVLTDTAANWRKVAFGFYNSANPATTATEQTNKIWVSNKLEYQASKGMLSVGISNDDGVFPNGGIKCHDVRDVSTVSSQEGANFIMTNNDLSGWWSGLHFKSSGGTYAAWELVGYANNGDGRTQPLYVRTSNKTTAWGSWRKIYDSSNPPTASEVSALPDTTKYAASSSVGGSATSAVKLDTNTAGTLTKPCYFSGGKPAACTYELKSTVPENAVFTDTWTAMVGATSSSAGTAGYIGTNPPTSGYNTKYWRADGTWSIPPDTKVSQTLVSGDADRPLLLAYSANSVATETVTNVAYRNNSIYANPSTGIVTSNKFTVPAISGVTFINKTTNAGIHVTKTASTSQWFPAVYMDTYGGGCWQIGSNNSSDRLMFIYGTGTNRTAGTNTTQKFQLVPFADDNSHTLLMSWYSATPTSGQVLISDGTVGGLKSSGYTIAKSVPANAEFTDTWDAMVGATSSAAGTKGYIGVDPPKSGYNTKFWGADATWKTAVTSVTIKGTSPISVDSESAITTTGTRTISLGTVPIDNGGTGATTALAATNNLGALNWASQGIKLTTENIDTDLTNGYTYYCVDAASTVNLSGTFPKGIQRASGATTGGSGFKIVCLQNYNSNYKFQILLTSNANIYYRAYTSGGSFGMWRIISQSTSTFYGTCSTAAATAAKTVTLSGNQEFELTTGITINVKFSNYNSATSPTLSVNGTTAKPIVKFGTTAVGTGTPTSWRSGAACTFTYDGTSWVLHEYEPYCVAQANVTSDANYQLLLASTSGTSTTSWFTATNKSAKLYFNPSSGSLSVNGYVYGAPFGITSYNLSTSTPLKWNSGYALASQSGATVQIIIQLLGSGSAATGGTDAYHGTLTGGLLPARDMTLIGYTGSTVIMGWLTTTGDLTARPMTNVTVGDGSGIYLTGTFIGM